MCGIAGYVGVAPPELLPSMLRALKHRGPDDDGLHVEPGIGLGSTRLAIIDLDTGDQPIANADGSACIVFNGEVYNFRDLRSTLQAQGHAFRTRSDTEVVLKSYEEWGDECVERLRGMFAFALWDRRRRRLLLARDRVGIKPLYLTRAGGALVCASEIKALFAFPGVARSVRTAALVEHLTLRYVASPATLFEGIEKLEPGHVLAVDASGAERRRFWSVAYEPKAELDDHQALAELETRLTESVRMRLMSEVPLGALLSGGVDSSVVVAI